MLLVNIASINLWVSCENSIDIDLKNTETINIARGCVELQITYNIIMLGQRWSLYIFQLLMPGTMPLSNYILQDN